MTFLLAHYRKPVETAGSQVDALLAGKGDPDTWREEMRSLHR
jgi:hypothetical protein